MRVLEANKKTIDTLKYAHSQIVDASGQSNPYIPPSPGGRPKRSYFTPRKTDSNKIKIIDGFNIDNANCGQVSVNKLALAPVVVTELTITADAYIYLECVGVGDPLTSSTNTIVQYATEQSWEAGKEKQLISRVTFAGTAITDFSNEPVSSRVIIWGAC